MANAEPSARDAEEAALAELSQKISHVVSEYVEKLVDIKIGAIKENLEEQFDTAVKELEDEFKEKRSEDEEREKALNEREKALEERLAKVEESEKSLAQDWDDFRKEQAEVYEKNQIALEEPHQDHRDDVDSRSEAKDKDEEEPLPSERVEPAPRRREDRSREERNAVSSGVTLNLQDSGARRKRKERDGQELYVPPKKQQAPHPAPRQTEQRSSRVARAEPPAAREARLAERVMVADSTGTYRRVIGESTGAARGQSARTNGSPLGPKHVVRSSFNVHSPTGPRTAPRFPKTTINASIRPPRSVAILRPAPQNDRRGSRMGY